MPLNIPLPDMSKWGDLSDIFQNIIKNRQEALSNEQLNKYRMGSLDVEKQKASLEEKKFPLTMQKIQAEIEAAKALAKMRNEGNDYGYRGNAMQKDVASLHRQIMMENPGISPNKAIEIGNAYLSGEDSLSDGTPVPKMSGLSRAYVSSITKRGSTASLLTQDINSRKAESEVDILSKYANEGLAPYGDTFLGYSTQQIHDTFGKDEASQERLGKFIGSQALQYEIAQIRNRLAQGQPGITATQELMKESEQHIKTLYPRLSAQARKVASDYINKALKEGLKARQKIGVSASSSLGVGENNEGGNENVSNQEEVEIYDPQGNLWATGNKEKAAEFLKKHRGYYQKVIKK